MTGKIIVFFKGLKRWLNKKGQGIVEFALLCSFCLVIGLFARDAGFTEAFNDSLENSKGELYSAAIGLRSRNSYMKYFRELHNMTSDEVRNSSYTNAERIEADQKALVKIAETYLGKTEGQVLDLMNFYSNSPTQNSAPDFVNGNKYKCDSNDGTGFSIGVLSPLSYAKNTLNGSAPDDKNNGWLWLDANNNQNTVLYLTDNKAITYDKFDRQNPCYSTNQSGLKTITTDRLFYSNDVLDTASKVTVRLHYTDGKVDFVDVALRKSDSNTGGLASGLCLHVTDSGYTKIDNTGTAGSSDIINNPKLKDKKGNPVYYDTSIW